MAPKGKSGPRSRTGTSPLDAPSVRAGGRQSSAESNLPSLQGAGSVSYGSPGQADLPTMLVYSTTKTLAETIEAEAQASEQLGQNMADEFQQDRSTTPATRRTTTRSVSEETELSQGIATPVRGRTPAGGRTPGGRGKGRQSRILTPVIETSHEQEDEGVTVATRAARPSSSNDPTASFVQERGIHRITSVTGEPLSPTVSPITPPGSKYSLKNALLYLTPMLCLLLVFGLLSTTPAKVCRVPGLSFTNHCKDVNVLHSLMSDKEFKQAMSRAIEHMDSDVRVLKTNLNAHMKWVEMVGISNPHLDQVNFFAPGNGAITIPSLTSVTFRRREPWLHRQAKRFLDWPEPFKASAALQPWREPGECWCGSTTERDRQWTQFAVSLPRAIYPSTIVIDHIPKTQTLHPRSIPKDIELWAHVPSAEGQDELIKSGLGKTSTDDFFDRFWIRILTLKYDHEAHHFQPFDIPDYPQSEHTAVTELAVRATSNYGAKDHTCFYRVMMGGVEAYPEEEEE